MNNFSICQRDFFIIGFPSAFWCPKDLDGMHPANFAAAHCRIVRLKLIIQLANKAMNAQFLKDQWSVIRATLREKYPNLTDNDLAYVHGSEEEIFDRVERRTGLKREEVERTLLEHIGFAA